MILKFPILTNSEAERQLMTDLHDLCRRADAAKKPGHGMILDPQDGSKPLEFHMTDYQVSHGAHHPDGFVLTLEPGLVK